MNFIVYAARDHEDALAARVDHKGAEPGTQFATVATEMHDLTIRGILAGRFIEKVYILPGAADGKNYETLMSALEKSKKKNPALEVIES